MRGELTKSTRLRDASLEVTEMMSQNLETKRAWAENAPDLDTPVTVAQRFASESFCFYLLLFVGMAKRAIEVQLEEAESEPLRSALRSVEDRFDGWAAELEEELDYEVIPIKTLVEIQLGAALHFISALESR